MTRDYAKQKSSMKHGYSPSVRLPSPWTFLTAGLVLGLFIGFLFYLQFAYLRQQQDEINENDSPAQLTTTAEEITAPHHKEAKAHKKVHKVSHQHQAEHVQKQPRFDFYTLLPSMDVDAPDMGLSENHEDLAPSEVKHPSFILQAGSFKEMEEADLLRALLYLQGFESPHIQNFKTHEGESRYRVYLGPYAKEDEVAAQKQRLEQFNIKDSLVLKAEPKH